MTVSLPLTPMMRCMVAGILGRFVTGTSLHVTADDLRVLLETVPRAGHTGLALRRRCKVALMRAERIGR